jgi:ligand-binding sensor domain-containing protein
MLKQLPVFLFLYWLTIAAAAQVPVFRHYTVKDGLPSRETYFVSQDSKGYIWVCTDAGIARFNGSSFKIFDSSTGLPDNTIFEVKEDRFGCMWFRSFSGQVGYIREDTVHTIGAAPAIVAFQQGGLICSLGTDSTGTLYIGRQGPASASFLAISPPYRLEDVKEVPSPHPASLEIRVRLVSARDVVFSECRPQRPDNASTYIISVIRKNEEAVINSGLRLIQPLSRVFRSGDHIYISNGEALMRVDGSALRIFQTGRPLIAVTENRDARTLMGFYDGLTLSGPDLRPGPDWLPGVPVSGILEDEDGGVWISTLTEGIYYWPSQGMVSYRPGHGMILGAIKTSDTSMVCAFENGTMIAYQHASGKLDSVSACFTGNEKTNSFFKTLRLNDHDMLCWNANGAVRFSNGKFKPYMQRSPNVYRFMIPYRNRILVSNYSNLIGLDSASGLPVDTFYFTDRLTALGKVSDDEIWAGGLHGLYRFSGQQQIGASDRILSLRVEDIVSGNGRMFIATKDRGVVVSFEGKLDTVDERAGLLSNICRSVFVEKNECWVVGHAGVSRIRASGHQYEVKTYPLRMFEGIQAVDHIFMLDSSLWFTGGEQVFSCSLRKKQGIPRFYINRVAVRGTSLTASMPTLHYDDFPLLITYEALFYDLPGHVSYRYRLHREDTTWNYTTESSLSLTSLSSGDYEVHLQARDVNGQWQEADRPVAFRIARPFWLMWWFQLSELIAAVGLIASLFVFRNRRMEKKALAQKRIQARMDTLEMKAIKAQMNPHFIFNCLNTLQQFILAGDNDNAYTYLSKFSKLVRKNLETTLSDSITLENEIDILRRYAEIENLRFSDGFGFSITCGEGLHLAQTSIPHMLIQPFVENAIWHGLAHKRKDRRLRVDFTRMDDKRIRCVVEDNGVGRAYTRNKLVQAGKDRSLAIDLIRERLQLLALVHQAELGIEIADLKSAEGDSGTLVTILLPIMN